NTHTHTHTHTDRNRNTQIKTHCWITGAARLMRYIFYCHVPMLGCHCCLCNYTRQHHSWSDVFLCVCVCVCMCVSIQSLRGNVSRDEVSPLQFDALYGSGCLCVWVGVYVCGVCVCVCVCVCVVC